MVCGEGVLGGSCGVTNGIFGAVRVNVVVLSWWFVFDRENKKLAAAVSVLKKKIFAVEQSFFGGLKVTFVRLWRAAWRLACCSFLCDITGM